MRVPAPRMALIGLIVALLAAGLAAAVIRAGDGGHKVASRAPVTTSTSTSTTAPNTTTTTAAPAPGPSPAVPPVLADQHFQFGPATYALDAADKGEQNTAFSGLLEGDAKTLEAQWGAKYLTAAQRNQASGESSGSASVYNDIPPFVVDSLLWPYTT